MPPNVRIRVWLLAGLVFLAVTPARSGQDAGEPPQGIGVIAVGEISRIDHDEASFRLMSLPPEEVEPGPTAARSGPLRIRGVSVSVGGSVTRGPATIGAGAGQPDRGPGPDGSASTRRREGDPLSLDYDLTRVLTTADTVIHEGEERIPFGALETGDRVTVRGVPDGDRIRATDVERRRAATRDED